jgi:predicted membrane metal-binding protein
VSGQALHESFERKDAPPIHSERSFGIVFAAVFLIIALWPLIHWQPPRPWALAIAALFGLAALFAPRVLAPLNRLWFRFGLVMHRVMSAVVLTALFFLTVVPIGLIYRALGKDPLRLKIDRRQASYWINREPPGPPPASMANQF